MTTSPGWAEEMMLANSQSMKAPAGSSVATLHCWRDPRFSA
jgi:hypothetical protein